MKTYSTWNNDLGDRQIATNDDSASNYSKNEYDEYLKHIRILERQGYVLSIPKPFVHTEGAGLVNTLIKESK